MIFYTEENNKSYPCFILYKDGWNDYGYYILYNLIYYTSPSDYVEIGNVKVLQKETYSTNLPYFFEHLDKEYCSLGQSLEYYSTIKEFFPEDFQKILKSLNDIALFPEAGHEFIETEGYKNGLMRFSSAEKASVDAKMLLYGNTRRVHENLSFTYFIKLQEAESRHEVTFDFKQSSEAPYRVNLIIGQNGTGKTRFLGSMVNSISGVANKDNFTPYNPLFNKVIAISYSLFDDFPKPPKTTVFNYTYIGLRRSDEELISDESLSEKLRLALKLILEKDRVEEWYKIVDNIIKLNSLGIESVKDFTVEWIENLSYQKSKRLSSGQSIVFFILSELIAYIQEESLILFDEPETHLHPSAISQLYNGFYKALETYKSFAIMSTHSPIIVQDVPAKYVTIFEREGNMPKIRKLPIESFGENISTITSTIFGTVDVQEMYKFFLKDLIMQGNSPKKINSFFDDKLSFNAQLYLEALNSTKNNEEF